MKAKLSLVGLLAACGSTNPTTPSGAPEVTVVRLANKTNATVGGDYAASAVSYVSGIAELTGAGDTWKVRGAATGTDHINHVRMAQIHDGVPVFGADLVAHADGAHFGVVSGTLVKNLAGFDVAPTFDQQAAVAVAKADYAGKATAKNPSAHLVYARDASDLVILPRRGRDARLAWHVSFFTELQGGMPPGLWNYFVDAKTGELLWQFNAIDTLSQASGPGGNPKFVHSWNMELDVEPSGTDFAMQTARLETYNLNGATDGGTIVVGPLDNISDAPIDDAHGYAEVTLNMLHDWQGFNSIDNAGFLIKSRVHYSTSYENAFWDGTQMTYGDGASTFYPLSGAIDVVAHEIDHGFTSFHSNLTYSGMSGGMNESFSDIAGKTAEFFYKGAAANFDLGGDIFKAPGAALRYMCNPTQDGASIDNAANYNDGLDVHYSSGVMNKAFCLSAKRLASGDPNGTATPDSVKRASTAWYLANASYWTASSDFTQGCQGVMDASAALGFATAERDAIRQSWADVGVFCDGNSEPIVCDDTLTTDTGELGSPNFPSNYPDNFTHTWCIKPASGNVATVHFTDFNTELNYDFVKIRDANGATLSNTSGTTAPADASSTEVVIKFTSDPAVNASGWHLTWATGEMTNVPPTVAVTSPANGATVSGTVSISATAADSDGTVASVKFDLPDGTSQTVTTAPYAITWNSASVADGAGYNITATSVDNLGAPSTPSTVTVTVHNAQDCINGSFAAADLPIAIPDNNPSGVSSGLMVSGTGNIGSLQLSLHITHTYIGDLRVTLTSPDGTQYVVSDRAGGSADNLVITNLDVGTFDAKKASGRWQLHVADLAAIDTGTIDSWSLAIVGDCSPPMHWSGSATPNLPTIDNGQVCDTLTVTSPGYAGSAKLDIAGHHDWRSILRATLSHNGMTVEAFPVHTFAENSGTFAFTDRAIAGLSGDAMGDWTLCVIDTDGFNDTGVLSLWSVHD